MRRNGKKRCNQGATVGDRQREAFFDLLAHVFTCTFNLVAMRIFAHFVRRRAPARWISRWTPRWLLVQRCKARSYFRCGGGGFCAGHATGRFRFDVCPQRWKRALLQLLSRVYGYEPRPEASGSQWGWCHLPAATAATIATGVFLPPPNTNVEGKRAKICHSCAGAS